MVQTRCKPSQSTVDTETVESIVGVLSDPYGFYDEVVIDLSSARFVRPSGLVAMATYAGAACDDGLSVRVVCPRRTDCCDYLGVSGFLGHCSDLGIALEGSGGRESGRVSTNPTVLPLTRIATREDPGAAWVRVHDLVCRVMGAETLAGQRTAHSFSSALHEMATNAVGFANVGYVAAQRYKNYQDGNKYVEFAIGDSGPGIKETLITTYPHLRGVPHHEVLSRLVTERLTSTGGGQGYNTVREFTSLHGGQFHLRSRRGALSLERNSASPIVGETWHLWPGTFLSGSITVDS